MKEMSPTLKEFCEKQELMRLAYTDGRGYPRAVPVWFVVIEGEYYFGTDRKSVKWKAIERDPRVGWVIDGGQSPNYKGASMYGRSEEVKDAGLRARIHEALGLKYFGSADHPEFLKIYGQADDQGTAYAGLSAEDGLLWEY
ncbi:MAG TPA: pyridoxamine 5'-phosphate oxidase family protein [Blastocatellia bacterium]|nr:pyridoxamine 5'-phosphate oxidase family protein [Blastocatellia bacterium]